MSLYGVVGGSGLYEIPGLEIVDSVRLDTPYGAPSDEYKIGKISGREVAFLPRHGSGHGIQPHRINYRANIWGFKKLGAGKIISVGAVGGISPHAVPGAMIMPDQILDITSGRLSTFYDEDEVVHVDFTEPFCGPLRKVLSSAAESAGLALIDSGTYICVNGPRLETAAEIKTYSLWGADVVGMTIMPEAALAREAGICFANVSVVTNLAAGISGGKLTATEVVLEMKSSMERIRNLLRAFFSADADFSGCDCAGSLKDAGM